MSTSSESGTLVRVCAIDIGTNSVRTIVADVRRPDRVAVVRYAGVITRLGEGFGASRTLKPDAIARTVRVVAQYVEQGRRLHAGASKLVATSAARDAENGRAFLDAACTATGHTPEIVSGTKEAQLVLAGVRAGRMLPQGATLIVDIGGGSTELIACDDGRPTRVESMDVGAVRLTERFLQTDPPTSDEMAAASQAAEAALHPAIAGDAARPVIGLGGTITSMAAMSLQLPAYDEKRVHGHELTLDAIDELVQRTASLTISRRRGMSGLEPGREDVILGGMLLARAVLVAAGAASMRACTTGILHGIALDAAGL
jgi:exopolyphosphatase/guanosine-5'-triphosphate,3'-diphosphate pyrophosphatase